MSTKKKKTERKEAVLDVQEEVVEVPQVTEVVEETVVAEKAPNILEIKVYRDGEGRIVLTQEGKPNRIAGSDEAFVEVARQFATAVVKERQI